jgi:pyridoxine 5-phosphate synthase
MTNLSVNINKIALLRNSRGHDYPSVLNFAKKFIDLGAKGITIHPRQDERHITMNDAYDLGNYFKELDGVELNIEGYPSEDFLSLVESIKPDQCTLVPDGPNQLTSDHGWDLEADLDFVKGSIVRLKKSGIRTAIFLDPDVEQVKLVPKTKADRIELYTEQYASSFHGAEKINVFKRFEAAALLAQKLSIGVNAGHDLDLENLPKFLEIDNILEVSIGHVLIIECIENGMPNVIEKYLNICN